MLTPVAILVVDQLPAHNTGALIKGISEFVFDDAAIVACLLRQWDVPSGLIGTAVGNDARGRSIVRQLKAMGVQGKVRVSNKISTPLEVDVSDQTGARTYFWRRESHVLATLDTADLSLLHGAKMLYVDWYDGDHILRAMDEAIRLHIPVFLNLEHGHQDPELLKRYVQRATVVQAVTDAAQTDDSAALAVARKLCDAGATTAIITLAAAGSLAIRGGEILRVHAPQVPVVDGCGAGATFSTGFIYAQLRGWDFSASLRFATAAASLKVTQMGLKVAPALEIQRLAATIPIECGTTL